MKKLSSATFNDFLSEADTVVVMFGSPIGEATRDQAIDFAEAWRRRIDLGFGYVDAFEEVELARRLSIRVLPTTILLQAREIVERYEGHHSLSF